MKLLLEPRKNLMCALFVEGLHIVAYEEFSFDVEQDWCNQLCLHYSDIPLESVLLLCIGEVDQSRVRISFVSQVMQFAEMNGSSFLYRNKIAYYQRFGGASVLFLDLSEGQFCLTIRKKQAWQIRMCDSKELEDVLYESIRSNEVDAIYNMTMVEAKEPFCFSNQKMLPQEVQRFLSPLYHAMLPQENQEFQEEEKTIQSDQDTKQKWNRGKRSIRCLLRATENTAKETKEDNSKTGSSIQREHLGRNLTAWWNEHTKVAKGIRYLLSILILVLVLLMAGAFLIRTYVAKDTAALEYRNAEWLTELDQVKEELAYCKTTLANRTPKWYGIFLEQWMNLKLDGYLGAITMQNDQAQVLIYLTKKGGIKEVKEQLQQREFVLKLEENKGILEWKGDYLYKYMLTFSMKEGMT